MHDAKGRELKVGDTVVVPFKVKSIYASETHCNVELVTVASMEGSHPPSYTTLAAINTKQTLRANPGDDRDFTVTVDGAATRLT